MSAENHRTCPYFLVENPHETTVIPVSILITILSTIVNCVGFYVILWKSKKETKLFRFTLFGNQFTLWLSQGFWAISMNTMPLFPFPALYASNLFNNYVSTHRIFFVWIVLLSIFGVFLVGQLVVRHRMVVRAESFFNFPEWFYIFFLVGGWSSITSFLLTVWNYCDTSESDKFDYIQKVFPDCLEVFYLPGVLVITNVTALYILLGSITIIGAGLEGCYIISSGLMLFELSQRTRKMSNCNFGHQKKIFIDTTVQILIKLSFLSLWAFWIVASYFIPPQLDTRVISLIINSLFVAAPIPGTISMIIQNSGYRNFVVQQIFRRRASVVSPSRLPVPS